ncbi:fimbrial protein [Lelliottia sp. WAP21]|uniref:fimbrial protein n=1 Tax=Lelliottia sp. WAP21 TaxID=2877426 RepID=UPI001E60E3E7|nr:fimbrial protein [Lelliottia sp. WAP21]
MIHFTLMRSPMRLRDAIFTLMISASGPAFAVATGDSRDIAFHGTLKIHPCHINNDRDLSIHFDNVGIHKVDGQRYKQAISYQLVCDDIDPTWRLTMIVKGSAAAFDASALSTNAAGLGIQILQNGQPFEINKALDITYQNPPTLEAVPVKDPNVSELSEGAFSATATLLAEYL